MAKFTSQEVEALQKGGNQRAREIYLKDWDSQRLRLADNSNADKIREFIKNVYIDKKFVGGMSSDRPPRDSQKLSSHEEEIRRASSYHSYSQSPPYDFQYEERRYGKHAPVLSRKPGSDRGLYYGKFSSFLSPSRLSDRSPSNFSDHMHEDGFANERSNSMISNYSASSGGDPFRSGVQSPNFQKEIGSPSSETSRDFSGEDVVNYTGNAYPDSFARRDGGRMSRPQRTAFSGSFGSFDSDSSSFKSINPVGLVDVAPGPEPVKARYNSTSTLPSFPQSSIPGNSDGLDLFSLPCAPKNVASTTSDKEISNLPGNSDGLDLFNASYAQQNVTSASTINMSHVPGLSTAQSLDLFGPSPISTTPTFISHQLAQSIPPASLDLFSEMPRQQPAANFTEKTSDVLVPQNEGWATFDMPQHSAPVGTKNSASATIPSSNDNSVIDPLASLSRWPSFQDISAHTSSSAQTLWSEASEYVKAMTNTASTESWNAFEDSTGQLPGQNVHKSGNQNALHHPSTSDQYLSLNVAEEFKKDGSQIVAVDSVHLMPSVSSHISMTPDDLSILPVTAGIHSYPVDHKSTNPFELPYDLETECDNTSQFWDISSLQAALPNGPSLTSFTSVTNQPWFPQDPMAPYASEGTLGFMAAQASSTHLSTVPAQGPVASIGGNPFAL